MAAFGAPRYVQEVAMKMLLVGTVLLLMVPALRAQQSETAGNPPQAAPEATAPPAKQNNNEPNSSPTKIRQGHPLDPADVDVLTGKRDREIEAARQAQATARVAVGAYGDYGNYGDYFWMNGRLGTTWDIPILPLAPIANPFYFSRISPRGFGPGGLRGRR
jgi:hypothetical protein